MANELPDPSLISFDVPYRGTRLSIHVELLGEPLRREHVALVIRYLEIAAEGLPDVTTAAD